MYVSRANLLLVEPEHFRSHPQRMRTDMVLRAHSVRIYSLVGEHYHGNHHSAWQTSTLLLLAPVDRKAGSCR